MDIKKTWKKNNKIIILVGFGIGILHVAGFLPETIELLKDYTVFFYGGLLALSAFTFYKFYWDKSSAKPGYERYVPNRNLNNPRFTDDVLRSKGIDPNVVVKNNQSLNNHSDEDRLSGNQEVIRRRNTDVFDKFKQDY